MVSTHVDDRDNKEALDLKPIHIEDSSVSRQTTVEGSAQQDEAKEFHGVPLGKTPTQLEMNTLRRIPSRIPFPSRLVIVVELCERFAYFGVIGPMQNYIQHGRRDSTPGWLGLGQARATSLNLFFQFWCYFSTVIGAIVADQYLGRYKTILYFGLLYMLGDFILTLTSIPQSSVKLIGLILSMIIIGLGAGGIKSNISSLTIEQCPSYQPVVQISKKETVIVDFATTVSRMVTFYYWAINVGSLSPIATTHLEKNVEFWAAFLLPLCAFVVGMSVYIANSKRIVKIPPQEKVLLKVFKVFLLAARNRFNLDAAKESQLPIDYARNWDDAFIDELRRGLMACKIFLFFPIYWACFVQGTSNLISQAGTMRLDGIPNDLLQNVNPLAVVFLIPFLEFILYPWMKKRGLKLRPISRITTGFFFVSTGMAYTAVVQRIIYKTEPYYDKVGSSGSNNNITIWLQLPSYFLIAISDVCASMTGIEYAYSKAPASMKSIVTALFHVTNAIGSLLGMVLSPLARDPLLVWMYAVLSMISGIAGSIIWVFFNKYNYAEDEMNALDSTVQSKRQQPIIGKEQA